MSNMVVEPPKRQASPSGRRGQCRINSEDDLLPAQARAVADTIHQLQRGVIPKGGVKLPLFTEDGTAFANAPAAARSAPRSAPARRSADASLPALERHRRKCIICKHPDREEIEDQFVHWHKPGNIAYEFGLEDDRYICRHARALGLYAVRRENYLSAIENVLERGDDIDFTAAAYIKAVRAYACMCGTVRWTEPAIRVLHEHNVRTDLSSQSAGSTLPDPSVAEGSAVEGPPPRSASPATHPTDGLPRAEGVATWAATTLPQAAVPCGTAPCPEHSRKGQSVEKKPSSLPKADSNQSAPAAHNTPHLHSAAEAARITGIEAGDSAPEGNASAPLLASSFEPLASGTNRPSPRLESELTDTKQRKEVRSNRPQFAK